MKIIIIIPKCNWTRPVETVLLTEKNFLMKKTSILRYENRIVLFRQDDTLDNRISSCIRWRNTSSHIKWTGCECKKNETSTNVRELHSFVTLICTHCDPDSEVFSPLRNWSFIRGAHWTRFGSGTCWNLNETFRLQCDRTWRSLRSNPDDWGLEDVWGFDTGPHRETGQ